MNKKFLSLVLALVMVLGTFGNVFAAAATDKKDVKEVPKLTSTEAKAKWLIDNKYVVGTADKDGKATGDMDLKSPIRRDAVSKMLVFAIGEQDLAAKLQGVYTPFPDVKVDNIMNGFISAAASKTSVNGVPIIVGYEDGTFRPTKNVSYAELAKMLVAAIDKDLTPAVAKTYSWPQGWMDRAARLGLFEGLSIADANKPTVRSDAFAMIYNAFYQMKELKAVPSNEFRGIISEQTNGTKLVLNQGDFKKEFKINENTVFVKEAKNPVKHWLRDFSSKYYVGSLVRVLFDKDGVATHVIEMGNPVDRVKNPDNAWVDLGKIQLQTAQSIKADAKAQPAVAEEKVKLNDKDIEFVTQQKHYAVTSKTMFYVADVANGVLTQVKDYAAAKDLVGDETENVYLGYENLHLSKSMEAKVVVFNMVKKDSNMRTVRVAKAVSNADYKLFVQAPGYNATTTEEVNKRNDSTNWPYNYGLDADDILGLGANGVIKQRLDASEAPVVTVNKLLKYENGKKKEVAMLAEANAIELVDKTGMAATYDLPTDFDAFFGKDIVKGAKVQFLLDGMKIDVLSVVNRAEKGTLSGDVYDTRVKTGVVEKINAMNGLIPRIFIRVEGEGVLEYVTTDDRFQEGALVDYRVTGFNKNDTKPEVVLAKVIKTKDGLAMEAAFEKAFAEITADGRMADGKFVDAKQADIKNKLDAAVTAQGNMKDGEQAEKDAKKAAKEKLNALIKAYNELPSVKANNSLKVNEIV